MKTAQQVRSCLETLFASLRTTQAQRTVTGYSVADESAEARARVERRRVVADGVRVAIVGARGALVDVCAGKVGVKLGSKREDEVNLDI